nr:PREDICTED: uncharacterized protein LOC108212150 [Daucus carota subsp. sativus]
MGLMNAGATYQKTMNKIFHKQIGRNLEVYVDDMIIKSTTKIDHLEDLRETLQTLREYRLKLNPLKCSFAVTQGKFLGHLISERGIEANPDKIDAILQMNSPSTPRQIQSLNGCLTSLRRFVSRLAEKSLPFCEALRGINKSKTYALVLASRKLRPYFQGHDIKVYTNYPLRKILHKPDLSGRLVNWAVELSQYNVQYIPRNSLRGQALDDFLLEDNNHPLADDIEKTSAPELPPMWTLYVDGSSTTDSSGAGVLLISPDGFEIQQSIRFEFPATNNCSEYEAFLAGLRLAHNLKVDCVRVYSDSQLVVNQILGSFEARAPLMARYLAETREKLLAFKVAIVEGILREENARVDKLARLATGNIPNDEPQTYCSCLLSPSVQLNPDHTNSILTLSYEPNWMTPILLYIQQGIQPEDTKAARALRAQAAHYSIIGSRLYRRSYLAPLLKCLDCPESEYCMLEIHEGICGSHSSGEALAHKVLRQGYYWPNLKKDCHDYVRRCPKCQIFSTLPQQPAVPPLFILSPIPFDTWGMDIMGPFPTARGGLRFLIVAVDYMTKWAEAKAVPHITAPVCRKFFHEYVVTRFGIPRVLITDNGRQFVDREFEEYLTSYLIQHKRSSVAYPQSNGQVEVTNRTLLRSLQKNLEDQKTLWAEELPNILWAYRTDVRKPTGESPFRLAFGTEALTPVEIGEPSQRLQAYDSDSNTQGLRAHKDLLPELRETAVIRMANYKNKTAQYFRKIRPRDFQQGDKVLRATRVSDPTHNRKLDPNWEGPYIIQQIKGPGTYVLSSLDGDPIPNTWHISHLRRFYP